MDLCILWSKVKELGKFDQIDWVMYGIISEFFFESIDGIIGMFKGKCLVWSFGILIFISEDVDLKIQL